MFKGFFEAGINCLPSIISCRVKLERGGGCNVADRLGRGFAGIGVWFLPETRLLTLRALSLRRWCVDYSCLLGHMKTRALMSLKLDLLLSLSQANLSHWWSGE